MAINMGIVVYIEVVSLDEWDGGLQRFSCFRTMLYLVVRCLAARWTDDFYHVVSQYLEDTTDYSSSSSLATIG